MLCYNYMIRFWKRSGSVKPYGARTGKRNQTAFHQGGPPEILPAASGEGKNHSRQPAYPGPLEPVPGYPGPETDPQRHGLPDPPDQREGLRSHGEKPGEDGERLLQPGGIHGASDKAGAGAPGFCSPAGPEAPDPAPGRRTASFVYGGIYPENGSDPAVRRDGGGSGPGPGNLDRRG